MYGLERMDGPRRPMLTSLVDWLAREDADITRGERELRSNDRGSSEFWELRIRRRNVEGLTISARAAVPSRGK